MSEQRLEGFAKAKTATPFHASEQERHDNILDIGQPINVIPHLLRDLNKNIRRFFANAQNDINTFPRSTHAKRVAFTLAEVLITLAIVGIVAAMTIPTLITNYQKQQTIVQLKKVYADLNNAVKLSEIDNGSMELWDYPQNVTYNYEDIAPFIEKYYLPYFNSAKLVKSSDFDNKYILLPQSEEDPDRNSGIITNYLILSNGVILSFFANLPVKYIWCFADINGKNGPNVVGRDIFVFDVYIWRGGLEGTSFRVKFWDGYFTRDIEYYKNTSQYACNKENTDKYRKFFCGKVIELSGWEITEDYPW